MLAEGFSSIVEHPLETVPSDLVPYNGKIFSSHDDAYEIYRSFTKAWGRYYVCHRAGHLANKEVYVNNGERDRSSKRCNCGAHISIAKVMDSNISYRFVVTFDNLHNHDVLEPQEVRFLLAYHNISKKRSLKPRELPFIDKNIYNFFCAMNNANHDNDAHILLTKYMQMKDRNKDFKYDFTVSEDNRLEHIAWSHGSCYCAYEIFGDVVVFDTTYQSNGYSMPFSIWVGVNNHGDTCLFGCAFVGLINRKMPQTILTDQDLALKEAICKDLPNTKHAFYFEEGWHALVNKFALHSDRHINNLWNFKEFWALSYLRSHFFAGMKTTGCSESINASVKRLLGSQTPLSELIDQITIVIEMRDVVGQRRLMQQLSTNVDVRTMCSFEHHAAPILTPCAFSKIQEEIISSFQYLTSKKDHGTYEAFSSCSLQGTFYSNSRPISAKTILEHVEEVECIRSLMVDETSNASLATEEDENRVHCESIHVKNHVLSMTKGQPPEKRFKPHIEVVKKPKHCKVPSCGQTGHDYKNCPLRRG
ncbi:hypothetical protein AMTRI_Chr04g247960 [Amborella trichopoda]